MAVLVSDILFAGFIYIYLSRQGKVAMGSVIAGMMVLMAVIFTTVIYLFL